METAILEMKINEFKLKMAKEIPQPFIAAACHCFQRLSECPELKNYRIYREPGASPHPPIQEYPPAVRAESSTTTTTRHWTGKWILVVSAKRSTKASLLDVKVRGYRYGSV
jgi:hypothetical protein